MEARVLMILVCLLSVCSCHGDEKDRIDLLEDKIEALHKLHDADTELLRSDLKVETGLRQAAEDRLSALERTMKGPETKLKDCQWQQKDGVDFRGGDFFMKPSFISDWVLIKSYDDLLSDQLIDHPLGSLPLLVDLQVKPVNGSNVDWVFPGSGAIQSSNDPEEAYGGVVFLYNEDQVRIIAPTLGNGNRRYRSVVYTGGEDKWLGRSAQSSRVAMVRVRVWGQDRLPPPTFQSDWLDLDIFDAAKSFYEVEHGLGDYPDLVSVQVKAGGWYSVGIGSVMSLSGLDWHDHGGVIHGHDQSHVRVWTASITAGLQHTGLLFGSKDGWGNKAWVHVASGQVRVLAWSGLVSQTKITAEIESVVLPYSNNEVCFFADSSMETGTVAECGIPLSADVSMEPITETDLDNDLVIVSAHALDGPNEGFRFPGSGSAQSNNGPYGGVLYGYNGQGRARVWRPNPDKDGYMIHVAAPYGNGENLQASNNASLVFTLIKPFC